MKAKIATKTLAAQAGPFVMWDTEVIGFYARRQTEAGKITYAFRYTAPDGAKREVKLGVHGALTPDQARDAARIQAGAVAKNSDPAADRDARRAAKTVAQVWAEHETLALHKRKPKVQVHYRSLWTNHLSHRVGDRKIADLTTADIEALHKSITDAGAARELKTFAPPPQGGRTKRPRLGKRRGGKTVANHAVELLSVLCNRAGVAPNPCRKVERNKSASRDLVFSDAEITLVLRALDDQPIHDRLAFRLFLETPVRHGTVAAAEWAEFVDLERNDPQWRIFGEKLKGGRPYTAFLSAEVAALVVAWRKVMQPQSPRYLFPLNLGKRNGTSVAEIDPSRPRVTFLHAWRRIAARAAELAPEGESVRALKLGSVHTFKHTYLSRFADLGASAIEVQQAGDHTDIRTSMRYVKASGARMRDLQAQMRAKLTG